MILDCGCPDDYPDWHNQDLNLAGQCVHNRSIPMFLHMPVTYEINLQRQQEAIEGLHVTERWPGLILTRTGLFRGQILRLLKDTESPSRHIQYLPTPFNIHAVLHQGDIEGIRKPVRAMQMMLLDQGHVPKELYICHLTCPRCQEDRGGEKILLIRRWVENPKLVKKLAKRQQKKAAK